MKLSIFKVVNYTHESTAHLQDRLTYIRRVEATRTSYIYAVNVSGTAPFEQMMYVKDAYNQNRGKTHYHYVLSPEADDFDVVSLKEFYEVSQRIAKLIAEFYGQFQVVSAVHLDGEYPHLHIIANNIDFETGERFDLPKRRLYELKEVISDILRRAGMSEIKQYGYEMDDRW